MGGDAGEVERPRRRRRGAPPVVAAAAVCCLLSCPQRCTATPSGSPSYSPSLSPSAAPSAAPVTGGATPSAAPSATPSAGGGGGGPSAAPSAAPTNGSAGSPPSAAPSGAPSGPPAAPNAPGGGDAQPPTGPPSAGPTPAPAAAAPNGSGSAASPTGSPGPPPPDASGSAAASLPGGPTDGSGSAGGAGSAVPPPGGSAPGSAAGSSPDPAAGPDSGSASAAGSAAPPGPDGSGSAPPPGSGSAAAPPDASGSGPPPDSGSASGSSPGGGSAAAGSGPPPGGGGSESGSGCSVCGAANPLHANAACSPALPCATCSPDGQQDLPGSCAPHNISTGGTLICFGGCREGSFECGTGGCTVRCVQNQSCEGITLTCPEQMTEGKQCRLECNADSACSDLEQANVLGAVTVTCSQAHAGSCSPYLLRLAAQSGGGGDELPSWAAAIIGISGALIATLAAFACWYYRSRRSESPVAYRGGPPKSVPVPPPDIGTPEPLSRGPPPEESPLLSMPSHKSASPGRAPLLRRGVTVEVPSDPGKVHQAILDHPSLAWHDGYLRGIAAAGEIVEVDVGDDTVLVRFEDPPAEAWYPSALFGSTVKGRGRGRRIRPRATTAAPPAIGGLYDSRQVWSFASAAATQRALPPPGAAGPVAGRGMGGVAADRSAMAGAAMPAPDADFPITSAATGDEYLLLTEGTPAPAGGRGWAAAPWGRSNRSATFAHSVDPLKEAQLRLTSAPLIPAANGPG